MALRPPVADRLLAAGSLVLSLAMAITFDAAGIDDERGMDPWGISILVAMSALLLVRRRWPMSVLTSVIAVSMPYHMLEYPHEATMPASLVAVFTVGLYSHLPRKMIAAAVVLATATLLAHAGDEGDASEIPRDMFVGLGWLLAALLAGFAVRYHLDWRAAVTARIERERADEVERRVAEERVRIARELHDVLAHGVTVANVQASVAAHLIDQLPARDDPSLSQVSRTLQDMSETSRATLHELRAVLEVLHGSEPEPTEPAPRLTELHRLVEMAETAGVQVDVEADGVPSELPSTVDVVAYRIIQESLTNVIRHSMAKHATVGLDHEPQLLRITIVDDGPVRSPATSTAGFGILGMTGRAQAVGGELSAQPLASGGFEVRAALPLPLNWRGSS